jgi:hypothetical protein
VFPMSTDPSGIPEGAALEIAGSFRDPDGHAFRVGNKLYRAIHQRGLEHIALLQNSGLYEELTSRLLLIPHAEAPGRIANLSGAPRVIEPHLIPFISQPYEWCFSQLRDAAKCTLQVQNLALEKSMILADASAFNIQFHRGSPLLMDTLSLKSWNQHRPWAGYRQFCEHFLGPLALSRYRGVNASGLLQVWMEGIPLRIASRLLPLRSWLNPAMLMHIHLHSLAQHWVKTPVSQANQRRDSTGTNAVKGLALSLLSAVESMRPKPETSAWSNYYEQGVAGNEVYQRPSWKC